VGLGNLAVDGLATDTVPSSAATWNYRDDPTNCVPTIIFCPLFFNMESSPPDEWCAFDLTLPLQPGEEHPKGTTAQVIMHEASHLDIVARQVTGETWGRNDDPGHRFYDDEVYDRDDCIAIKENVGNNPFWDEYPQRNAQNLANVIWGT
jgi:hypothetical protein